MTQVPAARNTLRILALLSRIDVPVSAARIRTELDLPRSSTYHLLREMEDAGFVMHIPGEQTYGLGIAAYEMASAYTTQQPLVRLGERRLHRLAESVGGSGHLTRLVGPEIVYLVEARSPGAHALVTDVGVHLPAHRTASGKAMLAMLSDAQVKVALATVPDAAGANHTAHTTAGRRSATAGARTGRPTLRELRAELAGVRERGFAAEVEEIARGQESLAVAIRDHLGRPAAAVTVTFPVDSLGPQDKAATVRSLREAADTLGAAVYGRGRR